MQTMWASWRSLLSRPRPVLSGLRHVRRHASGGEAPVMARPDRPVATKRHLYVVLDDHENGFGIHKLDVGNPDGGELGSAAGTTLRRLPEPPVIRVEAPTVDEQFTEFAALGSSIVGMSRFAVDPPPSYDARDRELYKDGVTVVYDTRTAALAVVRLLPHGLVFHRHDAAVAAGDRLYLFEGGSDWYSNDVPFSGAMHCLAATDHRGGDSADAGRWGGWDRFAPASPWSWSDRPRELPFDAESITAHAVHPRGRDVFVSAGGWEADDVSTFSYGEASGEWTRRGDWVLPFAGHGHYDGELDAWVGLHAAADDDDDVGTDGRLCACRVVTSTHQASDGRPEWKLAAEKLLLDDPEWRHVDARLVHMAERCEYCLVERLRPREGDEEEEEEESLGDGDKCLLRLTPLRVRYGEDGELTATASRPARSYKVSRYQKSFDAQAFWM